MALTLNAEQKSIVDIFATENSYIIPKYQRKYSWTNEQCEVLWEDLIFTYESNTNDFFLGNIILAKSSSKELEVIDGQQRLITLTLLIKAISFFDIDNKALQKCLWIEDRRTERKQQRVKSDVFEEKDNEHLLECLNIESLEELDGFNYRLNPFIENMHFFCDSLEQYENNKVFFHHFSDFLLDKVYLLPIQTEDSDQSKAREKALTIFETINNRGLDLSDADIFKAHLYNSALNKEKDEEFTKRWDSLVHDCKNIKHTVVDLFRVYMHILRGKNSDRSNEIALRQFFSRDNDEYGSLKKLDYEEVLTSLEKIIMVIQAYENCRRNSSQCISSKLAKWFQVIDCYTNLYPKYAIYVYLFLNCESNNGKLSFTQDKLNDLEDLMKNIIRYIYYRGSTTKIKSEIYNIIINICQKKSYKFSVKLKSAHFQYLGRAKKGFMLLSSYLDSEQDTIYPYYFDSIIKPKDIKSTEDWTLSNYYEYSNTLGNLIVLDSETYPYRNRKINEKKDYFQNSQLKEVRDIANKFDNWTLEDYKNRNANQNKNLIAFFKGE